MIAYEIYRRDPGGEDCLLGVLPERRKTLERINEESVMNWARLLVNVEMTENFLSRISASFRYTGLIPFVGIRKSAFPPIHFS